MSSTFCPYTALGRWLPRARRTAPRGGWPPSCPGAREKEEPPGLGVEAAEGDACEQRGTDGDENGDAQDVGKPGRGTLAHWVAELRLQGRALRRPGQRAQLQGRRAGKPRDGADRNGSRKTLAGLGSSTPTVVVAHVPLWAVYPKCGWVSTDAGQPLGYLKRFGSVSVPPAPPKPRAPPKSGAPHIRAVPPDI